MSEEYQYWNVRINIEVNKNINQMEIEKTITKQVQSLINKQDKKFKTAYVTYSEAE